jgi:hypothetical protein
MTTQRFVTHKDHIEGSPTNGRWILLDKEGTQKNGPQGYDYYLIDGNRISSPKWDDTYKIKTELNRRNDETRLPDGDSPPFRPRTPRPKRPRLRTPRPRPRLRRPRLRRRRRRRRPDRGDQDGGDSQDSEDSTDHPLTPTRKGRTHLPFRTTQGRRWYNDPSHAEPRDSDSNRAAGREWGGDGADPPTAVVAVALIVPRLPCSFFVRVHPRTSTTPAETQ